MEIKEIGNWNNLNILELYFDKVFQHYILKNNSSIILKPIDQSISLQLNLDKPSEQICSQVFNQFCVSLNRKIICCLSKDLKLFIFRFNTYKKLKTNTQNKKIVGFSFLNNPDSESFLFIVTSHGLNLYKMKLKTSSLNEIKSFQCPVMDYSFEEKGGILALISPSGKVNFYFLYQPKGSKAYNGPSFDLFSDKISPQPFASNPGGYNLLSFAARLDYNQGHVFKIYESYYFIHLDNLNGTLLMLKIWKDKVQIFTQFNIIAGIYGIGVSENLIFLQSYHTQETFIFDIQSHKSEFLVKVSHLENLKSCISKRTSAEISLISELNIENYFVSDAVTFDLKSCSFKTVKINPTELIENHPDDLKIILFLLRRDNCKSKVLEKLKDSLIQLTPVKKLEVIFSTLASAYSIAKDEKKKYKRMRNLSESFQHLELTITDIDPNDELKTDTGVTVLMQSDIYFFVFDPIYKSSIDIKYFAEALFSFVHLFIQHSLRVHFSIQYLLFKVLIKIEDYKRVQNLVENCFFTDSQDIALFLTSLGKTDISQKFPQSYLLGIDMLARLQLDEIIAQELADQAFYYESLEIHKSTPVPSHLLKLLIKNCDFQYD